MTRTLRRLGVAVLGLALVIGCGKKGDDDDDAQASPSPSPVLPVADAGGDFTPIAGINVPLIGTASTGATTYLWEQTAGTPALTITNSDQATAYAMIPDGTVAATAFTFQLTVTDGGAGNSTDEMTVTVQDAVFVDYLAAIVDANEIGSTEGLAVDANGLWVGSLGAAGFVSLFDENAAFVRRVDIGANNLGMQFMGADTMLVARAGGTGDVVTVDVSAGGGGTITTVTDQLAGGGNLGPCNFPVIDPNGNIYVTNRTGDDVLRYDANGQTTAIFLTLANNLNPNALAWGPEPDMLYVGQVGQVLRVPINANGTAGTPEVYVDNLVGEVDGLIFDAALNLWIGPGNDELVVAPYAATGSTTVTRSFANPINGLSRFINPTFGNDALGRTTFYWTNLNNKVGAIDVGIPALYPN